MNKKMIVFLLLIFILDSVFSFSETEKGVKLKKLKDDQERRWAVVIGVNDYQDKGILDLNKAKNDAKALGEVLKNQGEFDKVYILTDDNNFKENDYPTYFKIKDRLNYISKFLKPNDLFVFAFSGHGVTIDGESHLVVSDSRIKNLKDTSINLEKDVVGMLKKAGVKKSLLLIDACRENFQENKGINKDALKVRKFEKSEVAATFYATKSGEYSYEDPDSDYGAFTRFLVEGLKGAADKKTGNSDGIVSFKELSSYVEDGVVNWSLNHDKEQTPYTKIYGESYGDLGLTVSESNSKQKQQQLDEFEMDLLIARIEKFYNSKEYLKTINTIKELKEKTDNISARIYFIQEKSYLKYRRTADFNKGIEAFKEYIKLVDRTDKDYLEAMSTYIDLKDSLQEEKQLYENSNSIKNINLYLKKYPYGQYIEKLESKRKKLKLAKPENMVFVEGGEFIMGSENGRMDEKPSHKVILNNFIIGKYEVTQEEYNKIMKTNPTYFRGNKNPVEKVSWYDAIKYCNALSEKEGLAKAYNKDGELLNKYGKITQNITEVEGYRLPTEAEWEYAARGGEKTKNYKYSGSNNIDEIAWYGYEKSDKKTHEVGSKKSNELGIYDMSGNVWEWCQDWYSMDSYKKHRVNNPCILTKYTNRIIRGGGWYNKEDWSIISFRYGERPDKRFDDIGFRVVRNF